MYQESQQLLRRSWSEPSFADDAACLVVSQQQPRQVQHVDPSGSGVEYGAHPCSSAAGKYFEAIWESEAGHCSVPNAFLEYLYPQG